MRLDVAFFGRGRNPIQVKSADRIAHDVTWGTIKEDAIFVAASLLCAAIIFVIAFAGMILG